MLGDRVQQRHRLQAVARGARPGLLAHAARVDRLLHGADAAAQAALGDQPVAERDDLGEVVAGVDVQQRERHVARRERLLGEPHEHDRVLAAAEQQRGLLALGRDLADHVDGLGLERAQVRRARAVAVDRAGHARAARTRSCRARPSGPRGRRRGWCRARSRSTRSPGRAAGCTGRSRSTIRAPQVLLGPLDERVELPDPALVVPLDRLGVGPRRRLLAADAGDPGVDAAERALQRGDLALAAAVRRAGPVAGRVLDLDVDAEALLERPPGRERLREQHAGVDRDDAGVGRELDQLVDQDRLLLLEGAQHHQPRVVALDRLGQHLGDAHCCTGSSTGVELARPPLGLGAAREVAERLALVVVLLVEGEDPQQRLVEVPVRDLLDHDVAELRVLARAGRRCGCPSPRRTRRRPS